MSKEFAASGQLSAEQIEYIRNDDPGNYIDENDWNTLCDMALSSLTARDEVEKMRRRVEMYRDKARGNHEAYLKLYADFVGIEGVSHD